MLWLRRRSLGDRVHGRILSFIKHRDGIRHCQVLLRSRLDAIRILSDLLRIEDVLGQSQRRIRRNSCSIKGVSP